MRFMMIVKATEDSEAGVAKRRAIGCHDEVQHGAGQSGRARCRRRTPSKLGRHSDILSRAGGKPKITDGPFTEAKELIAGYTLIEVKTREEAIEWAKRMPDPHGFGAGQIERARSLNRQS